MMNLLLAAVAAFSFGQVEVNCPSPGDWTVALTREVASDGAEIAKITMDAPQAAVPPRVEVKFATALDDIGYAWDVNGNSFKLEPNWAAHQTSELARNIPLYVFFNGNDESRFSVAASECSHFLRFSGGACEEGSWLLCVFTYFDGVEAPLTHYETEIRIDARPKPFADAVRTAASWLERAGGYTPCVAPEAAFDPLYSSWYNFHQDVTDAAIEAECAIASRLGMKTLIVDDGWQTDDTNRGYAYCGDWQVSLRRFPDMAAHVKKVQAMGMKYMMWYSVPFVGLKSANYARFAGKYLKDVDGGMGAGVLDPRFPEVRRFLVDTYVKALKDWDIDGFKLDFIDSFRFAGEDPAVKEDYRGRDIKSVPLAVDRLMEEVRAALVAIKPDVLIEFRQSYVGPAIRKYGNMLRVGDCPGDARRNRLAIANLRLTSGGTAVHSDMLEWNFREAPEKSALFVLNSLFGVVQYSVMLREAPAAHRDMVAHWIRFSQEHRETLLKGRFTPHHPELQYPLIEAESAAERLIGVYDDGRVVDCGAADRPVCVLNATGRPGLTLKFAEAAEVAAYDTYGRLVSTARVARGLQAVACPEAGYVKVAFRPASFALTREGLVTPRGPVAWGDVIRVRTYQRAAQKNYVKPVTAKVRTFAPDRVRLACFEAESQAYVPVEVRLDGPYLRVGVESGDIVEPLACNFRVMALEVLPELLTAQNSSEGAYLLPLWGGAEVKLGQGERVTSVDRLYTHQAMWEKMDMINAFGLATPAGALLGIIDGGEFRAQVETSFEPSEDKARQVAVVGIRDDPADMVEHEKKEVLFRHLPEATDYTKMALAWGEYLREVRELTPLTARMADSPQLEKTLTSLRFNIFLGMKMPFRTDGSGAYFSSTTFAEAEAIVDAAYAAGIRRAWVCLVGWIKDGHDGAYPSHFPVNERAGGEAGLVRLIEKIRSYGWDVTPHDNIHSLYTASADCDFSTASITRAGEVQPMGVWAGGMTNLACPQMWMTRYGGDYERIASLGFGGVYYIDALGTGLFRCHDPRHPANEREFALGQLKVLGWARDRFGVSAVENPQAYALKYVDYGAMGGSGSRMWFATLMNKDNPTLGDTWRLKPRPLPFFSIAAHGLIAQQCSWITGYRGSPALAAGLYLDGGVPAIEVCEHPGAIGDYWKDSLQAVAEPYHVYYELLPELVSGNTVAFEELAPDAVHWTFDNGIEVWANASSAEVGGLKSGAVRILKNGETVYAK